MFVIQLNYRLNLIKQTEYLSCTFVDTFVINFLEEQNLDFQTKLS